MGYPLLKLFLALYALISLLHNYYASNYHIISFNAFKRLSFASALAAFCFIAFSTSLKAQVGNPITSLRAAELYADVHSNGKFTVYLKKYYDCGLESTADTEIISVQEYETMRILDPVRLKKQSQTIQENKNLQAIGNNKAGCVTVVIYSAEVDLGLKHMSYAVTWGYCCFDHTIANLDAEKPQGTSIMYVINNDGAMQKNTMPYLSELLPFIMKQNVEAGYSVKTTDSDGDKVIVNISTPFSLISEKPLPGNKDNMSMIGHPIGKTVITDKAPFKKIIYTKGFSESNPINAKTYSIDDSGLLHYKPLKAGKYISAVTIKDSRDNKTLSEHQCFFLIDVTQ